MKPGPKPLPIETECPCGCGYKQPKWIDSDWDKRYNRVSHVHKFKGGPPPKRVHRMCISHEGRARRKGLPWHMIDLRHVYQHYEGKCGICEEPVSQEDFTIDHILAIANGGGHVWENLQPAHASCNNGKGYRR